MSNAIFGKCVENLRKRVNVEIITDRRIALKRVAKPSFKRSEILNENLVIIQNNIFNLKLNRPIYVGFSMY